MEPLRRQRGPTAIAAEEEEEDAQGAGASKGSDAGDLPEDERSGGVHAEVTSQLGGEMNAGNGVVSLVEHVAASSNVRPEVPPVD